MRKSGPPKATQLKAANRTQTKEQLRSSSHLHLFSHLFSQHRPQNNHHMHTHQWACTNLLTSSESSNKRSIYVKPGSTYKGSKKLLSVHITLTLPVTSALFTTNLHGNCSNCCPLRSMHVFHVSRAPISQ